MTEIQLATLIKKNTDKVAKAEAASIDPKNGTSARFLQHLIISSAEALKKQSAEKEQEINNNSERLAKKYADEANAPIRAELKKEAEAIKKAVRTRFNQNIDARIHQINSSRRTPIHRAFNPGCQFDDMIVLIGEQGNGKSTIVRWLNMSDDFHREVKTINGKEAIEALMGGWICEVAELLAVTKATEAEAVKAFITCRADNYRTPYERHPASLPRRCSFIGTTNKELFLFDKTGNRRFYPVKCNINPYELHDHEEEIRDYIKQAWAEAVYLYKEDKLFPYAQRGLRKRIQKEQEYAMEDDWRVGAIQDYLEKHKNEFICVKELWHLALNMENEYIPRRDSLDIAQIVLSTKGWERTKKLEYTKWGKARGFKKRK